MKSSESLIESLDATLLKTSSRTCDKELFKKLVEVRDLFKELTTTGKMKLDVDRKYIDILDRFLFVAHTI